MYRGYKRSETLCREFKRSETQCKEDLRGVRRSVERI